MASELGTSLRDLFVSFQGLLVLGLIFSESSNKNSWTVPEIYSSSLLAQSFLLTCTSHLAGKHPMGKEAIKSLGMNSDLYVHLHLHILLRANSWLKIVKAQWLDILCQIEQTFSVEKYQKNVFLMV